MLGVLVLSSCKFGQKGRGASPHDHQCSPSQWLTRVRIAKRGGLFALETKEERLGERMGEQDSGFWARRGVRSDRAKRGQTGDGLLELQPAGKTRHCVEKDAGFAVAKAEVRGAKKPETESREKEGGATRGKRGKKG